MTIMTAAQIAKLNKMNRASKDVTLGTRLAADEASIATLETGTVVVAASHVVSSAQASASAIVIQTTIPTLTGALVQASRSGSQLYAVNTILSGSNINILSASAGTWKMAANDVINYVAF